MPAPSTPVLDDFNRADGLIGASWVCPIDTIHNANATIVSNLVHALSTQSGMWGVVPGNDQEVYFSTPAISGAPDVLEAWCRITNNNTAAPNGYVAQVTWVSPGSDTLKLFKVVAGAYTQIGSTYTGTYANGDKLGLQAIGTTINLYHFTAGSWNLRVTTTDSSQTAGGIGFYGTGNIGNQDLDDFGGGSLATAPTQSFRPDNDTATGSWTTTPLWSKVDEVSAGGDVITDTAV